MEEANDASSVATGTPSNPFEHPKRRIQPQNLRGYHGDTQNENEDLRGYMHYDTHPNGGASVVHMYHDELDRLSEKQYEDLALVFLREVFKEEPLGVAKHVMGIVHGAASHLPELVNHLGLCHPELPVKVGHLKKSEVETMRMDEYTDKAKESYSCGTFQYGPLLQLSLVGQVSEESGGYFPDILGNILLVSLHCYRES